MRFKRLDFNHLQLLLSLHSRHYYDETRHMTMEQRRMYKVIRNTYLMTSVGYF